MSNNNMTEGSGTVTAAEAWSGTARRALRELSPNSAWPVAELRRFLNVEFA
jgi:hypothetical protein